MAGNCTGQNKNKYIMWFFAYLVLTVEGLGRIDLRYLIAGHTKNFCDASFGLLKRSLRRKDILSPEDVVRNAAQSAICNTVETAGAVVWYDWRAFLEQFFDGQATHIAKRHVFSFSRRRPGLVKCKDLSTSPSWTGHPLLRAGITAEMVCNPQPPLLPLEAFRIHPDTYALRNQPGQPKVKGQDRRDQYLQSAVVDKYFLGDYASAREKFFADGSLGKG